MREFYRNQNINFKQFPFWAMRRSSNVNNDLHFPDSLRFSSGAQSCLILCDPMDCSMLGFLSITNSQSLLKLMSIESVTPSSHFIRCRPRLLLPSIFPNIRVFSKESVLHIRWPKYWGLIFNISPPDEHSGLISFRMDQLALLAI